MNIDVRQIRKEIEYYGNTVTVRVVTDDSYSKWGDASETTADTESVTAMVQTLSADDELVREGIFQSGDLIFWFKSDESNIENGNRIIWQSEGYEINEVIKHYLGDVLYSLEARTKKI